MSSLLREIILWEFRRWFRWKSTLITLSLALVSSLVFILVRSLMDDDETAATGEQPSWAVIVVGGHHLGLGAQDDGFVNLMPDPFEEPAKHLEKLSRGELSAVLVLQSPHEAVFYDNPLLNRFPFQTRMHLTLERARRALLLEELDVPEEERAAYTKPVQLSFETPPLDPEIAAAREEEESRGSGDTGAAVVVNLLMMIGVYVGLAVQFYAITAEKQQRVTEQILACITPQDWIDGKILGLSLLSLVTTLTYVLAMLIFMWVANPFADFVSFPAFTLDPFKLTIMTLAATGGFLLWITFFAGIAATVNDPNTSARGGFMVLPMVPFGLVMLAFQHPDSGWIHALSYFPPTASPLLATRLIMSDPPWWEIGGSLILLGLAVLVLRRMAGKVFGLAVLMHGKEPSWGEIVRWIRRA